MADRVREGGRPPDLPAFDTVEARLQELLARLEPEPEPEPVPEPEPEPAPEPEPKPVPEPELEPVPGPGPADPRARSPWRLPRVALPSWRLPDLPRVTLRRPARLADVPARTLIGAGVGTIALVALAVGLAVVTVRDGPSGPGGGDLTAATSVSASGVLRLPEPPADALPPEPRIRPVGVRSVELGLESAVVGVVDPVGCDVQAGAAEGSRARWFDPDPDPEADGASLRAVAPGEHGVAVLLGAAGDAPAVDPDADPDADATAEGPPALAGLGGAVEGTLFEVARVDGSVLRWRTVDVVTVTGGSAFPTELLVPVEQQLLLVVGCGVSDGGAERDVYVLAERSR